MGGRGGGCGRLRERLRLGEVFRGWMKLLGVDFVVRTRGIGILQCSRGRVVVCGI
jgi:hypothetical protein